jgi:hypothetical protein
MLLWIYPILASRFVTRFVTILGKKREPKGNNHWRKTEIKASLDLILIWWKERELLQRERGKRRSEKCQFGPRETEPSSHVQPNAVSSCPTWSLSTSPTRRVMRDGGVIFSPSSWKPQEEGMMSIAAKFFPQLRNQGLSFRRGADKRLKVMLASLGQLRTIYRAPRPSFALRAATWNLHTI